MIISLLIIGMLELTRVILSVIPDLPDTPTAVVDGGAWIIDTITGVISVLNYVFTPVLMGVTVVVIVAMFSFQNIYHATMWVLRKIPMINIK